MLLASRGQGSKVWSTHADCIAFFSTFMYSTPSMMTADATATHFLLKLNVYWYAILPQVRDQLSDIFTGPREACTSLLLVNGRQSCWCICVQHCGHQLLPATMLPSVWWPLVEGWCKPLERNEDEGERLGARRGESRRPSRFGGACGPEFPQEETLHDQLLPLS